jgi:hypothetical protein
MDEQRHPVATVGLLDTDDQGLTDLREPFDDLVAAAYTLLLLALVRRLFF